MTWPVHLRIASSNRIIVIIWSQALSRYSEWISVMKGNGFSRKVEKWKKHFAIKIIFSSDTRHRMGRRTTGEKGRLRKFGSKRVKLTDWCLRLVAFRHSHYPSSFTVRRKYPYRAGKSAFSPISYHKSHVERDSRSAVLPFTGLEPEKKKAFVCTRQSPFFRIKTNSESPKWQDKLVWPIIRVLETLVMEVVPWC